MPVRNSQNIPETPVANGVGVRKAVLISAEEAPNFAMRRFTIETGGGMPLHTNLVEHEQYVLRGRARVRIAGEIFEVSAGDVLFIPADVPHDYTNIGNEPFVFLCLVPNQKDVTTLVEG